MPIAAIAGRIFDIAQATGLVDQSPMHRGVYSNGTPPATTGTTTPTGAGAFFFNRNCDLRLDNAYVSSSVGSFPGTSTAMLVDGNSSTVWISGVNTFPIDVQTYHPGGAVVTGYGITANNTNQGPNTFKFQGSNDGATWTDLDSRSGVTWSSTGQRQAWSFTNTTSYTMYRIHVTVGNGDYLRWQGIDYTGATPALLGANRSGHYFAVVKSSDGSGGGGIGQWGTSGSTNHYAFGDVYDDMGTATRRNFTPTVSVTSAYHIYEVEVNGTTVTARIDGVQQYTATGITPAWASAPSVGASAAGGQPYYGALARLLEFDTALNSTDAATVRAELTNLYISVSSAVTVAAPVLASGSALPAPTVSVASGVTVSAPVLVSSSTLPAPTVSSVTPATVAAPVLASSATLLAPAVTFASAVTVAAPVLASSSVLRAPTVVTPAPATTLLDFRHARRLTWVENGTQVDVPDDVTLLKFSSSRGFKMRGMLTPVAPPLGVLTEWPIQRQAHLMPALSAATPRYRVGNPANPGEYAVDYGTVGRPHVFVGGQDYTYKRGVPVLFEDYATAVPFNATQASVQMPQLKPWDQPGTGDLSALTKDAPVEIVMVRPDDTLDYLWEGFFQVDEENSGTGEDYTFRAQGLFAQAAHEPWDPPVFMDATDIGWLVADALNGVTHRRWNKIPRVTTGILSRNRGSQGQSVWQYVQDLLSQAWTDGGRQWTIARVGPYSYRIQVKASTSVADWTVTKGAHGVEVNLSVDQSTRRDAIYGRGFAPDGGYWCGRVFPGLEFGVPPRYPMDNTSLNLDSRRDSTTDTGNGITTWQRQMRELGYPVTVDGVMNSADVKWVRKIQRDRGLTVDGSLGPQTWAATWENNNTEADLTCYRRPLATLTEVEPFLYSATGARIGTNPADDPSVIRHAMPEVDFGSGVKKSEAIELARKMLDREATPGISGTITLLTDPHEAGASRFDIKPGDNVKVVGHRGADVVLQVAEVSVQGLSVSLTVDSKARDALSVLAILERNRDALRDPSARTGTTDGSSLNKASVVQYESESKAGTVPRTAVNGDSGLWTIRKTFVSQVGVAKVRFTATSPKAELYVALFNRPIRTSVLASLIGDPGASSDGWYDNIDVLREKYGLMEVFGSPGSPGGYWPRQKGDGPLTGVLEDSASTLYDSPYGGFVWVAMFTSRSTWVEGRVFPAVPT